MQDQHGTDTLVLNGRRPVDGQPVMAARDLALGFGSTTVMRDITVDFPRGSITALVGPSGSGKTTFLRSLNRMNDKVRGFWNRGTITLEGQDVHGDIDPLVLRRRVGMVFQRPNPFPMSIQDNIVSGVRAHRMARRSDFRDIAETRLAEVGLWSAVADRLGDSPFRLSGGQQQLLCLARALAVEPEVLLLDEPTSSLDPRSTEAVEELLRRLTPGLTVIIVTHNLAQAKRLSDDMIFFYEGRLVETGKTAQMFDSPERSETARYLLGEADPVSHR
ncbi:MAG: phosphate-transport system ATP-binding protein transporter pstB [Acidimicrobiaceae bacterium]|nr:phosphate-transport system ATP-binding protein transporter pstB [Acidimicrobiaceae bacterium]